MNEREKAAIALACYGGCNLVVYNEAYEDNGFVTVTASIVVMDSEIDAYLKENNLCDLADRRDAEDEERRMEG